MQVEDDFLHKVLNVTVLRAAHEHHPVVGEALHCGFLPHLGAVPQLQLHLHGTLRAGGRRDSREQQEGDRSLLNIAPDIFFSLLLETHIKGNGSALSIHVSRAWARTAHTPQIHPAGPQGPPGRRCTAAGIVTECYPESRRGSGKGETTTTTASTTTNASGTH